MMMGTADNSISRNRKRFALALLVSCLALVSVNAAEYPTGVRNSAGPHRLSERQLQQVQESLRHDSGLMELGFDAEGGLTLGDRRHVQGGSATARTLLIAAVDSGNLYELESHAGSPEIAFARIHESRILESGETGKRIRISQVQIDFADFDRLQGAREAKMALDIGLALLHELVHGVLKLKDPKDEIDQIGDCDYHVNQMRRELQLPERLYYNPGITVTRVTGRNIVTANLEFVERAAAGAKPRAKYRLYWLPSEVSPDARNIAQLQEGTMKVRRR
jgi:hypothetical protein